MVVAILVGALIGVAALSLAVPNVPALSVAADAVSEALNRLAGPEERVAQRAFLIAAVFILLACPLRRGYRLPGGSSRIAVVGGVAALILALLFAVDLGAELIRNAARDVGAADARDASALFRIGYQIGYLGWIDEVAGAAIAWLSALSPSFATAATMIAPGVPGEVAPLAYAAIMSLAALAPVWLLVGLAYALLAPRIGLDWSGGAARLATTALLALLLCGALALFGS